MTNSNPVARIGDIGVGTCPCHKSPVSYVTTFITGSPTCFADGLKITTIGTLGVSSCGHITTALTGSQISKANDSPIHRVGDTGQNCGPYVTITGSPTVVSD